MSEKTYTERLSVVGDQAARVARRLVHEGNIRRLIVRNDRGEVVMHLPLTVGVAGTLLAPLLAGLGAIATLATHCTMEIERVTPGRAADRASAVQGGRSWAPQSASGTTAPTSTAVDMGEMRPARAAGRPREGVATDLTPESGGGAAGESGLGA